MGKSNRVRAERATAVATKASAKKAKEKKTSRIYSIVIAAVALFVLATIVISVVISSGFIMRTSKAMKSENYAITGNMFKYMVISSYDDFLSQYSSYLSYFSLDTKKPLAEQQYGAGSETAFLGNFEGTWLDYFVEPVKSQAEQILIYCEEADARGIALEDADKENIDAAMDAINQEATNAGYSLDAYVAYVYGDGMKTKDIRATMELSTLAAKAAEAVDGELMGGITAEEVKAKYEANTLKYDVVDYLNYSVEVSFDDLALEVLDNYDGKSELTDAQKATVLEKYKEEIAKAKEKVESFKAYTDAETFLNAVLRDVANESFDEFYETEALASADKLSEKDLATVKAELVKKVLSEIAAAEKEPADDTVETNGTFVAYGVTVTSNAAKSVDNIKTKLFSTLESAKESYGTNKANHKENDDFSKWAFDEVRKNNDRTVISTGDGSKEGEIKNENGYFVANVYFLEATRYPDKTPSKDVAYMSFATRDDALKAIEAIGAGEKLDLARFEAIAQEKGAAANGLFENYVEGQISYNGFEDWLYDDATIVGSYTATPLANATQNASEYAVFFYVDNGDELWNIDVKNDIFVDDYQVYFDALVEKYPITKNDKIIAKVEL